MTSLPSVPDGVASPSIAAALSAFSSLAVAGTSSISSLPSEVAAAIDASRAQDAATKVVILFQPTGSAPVLKQKYRKITASNRFQAVIAFLRKELGWQPQDSLFLYINAAFSPAPDDTVANLYKCFGTDGVLIVNYSSTAAWG
ncbi:Ubiquitin-like protein [Cystobasidiomycetes sp. EMM_F5]